MTLSILILTIITNNDATIHTQEFNSMEACEAAGNSWYDSLNYLREPVNFICVNKSND